MSLNTPVEIDTALAEALFELSKQEAVIDRQLRYRDGGDAYLAHHFDVEVLEAVEAEAAKFQARIDSLNDQYTGWPRYWHVTNANGHIHDSQHCASCFPSTQYGWRTDLSGLTAEEVVEREAYNACSVCMPIAPAEQKQARAYYNKQQREARKAEKDAIKAEKDTKKRERASKLVDKIEAAIEKLGGREVFERDYSQHGHDGRKSIYEWSFDNCQTTVADVLYFLKEEGPYKSHKPNEFVTNELAKRGLI